MIPGAANMLVKMDFHKVIEPMLWTLNDLGFNLKQIAHLLTRFPKLLKLSTAELSNRFTYFVQRGFSQTDTVELIAAQPLILNCTSVEIDRHLGQVQTLFGFSERDRLVANFVFMHLRLDLPIEVIPTWPEALTAAPHLLPQRATFLARRGLFQPDPTK
ncbi:unnamed protein product [Echinostoma caproni]|uniref:mTERF domain-containing protein 1, mitochondrial n=1 Tax=Echinostoma caproni TaxID=27848 RepID=A0A183ANK8_9TREM|nr:unnamed protein product [Echinostoma caproni]